MNEAIRLYYELISNNIVGIILVWLSIITVVVIRNQYRSVVLWNLKLKEFGALEPECPEIKVSGHKPSAGN